jgi:hypothetical protein
MAKPIPSSGPDLNAILGDLNAMARGEDSKKEGKGLEETPGAGSGQTEGIFREEGVAPEIRADLPEGDMDSATPREQRLKLENADLQERLEKLDQLLKDTTRTARYWAEQHREQEKILEEKTELIRALHSRSLEQESKPAGALPREEELLALSEELEQERKQIKDDEAALMEQMREMEVTMSRERAELARQRSELQRLHSEIEHQFELAEREAVLRDRLQPLQRRHQELQHRKGSEPQRPAPPAGGAPAPPPAAPSPPPKQPKESGIFRRLFGQD